MLAEHGERIVRDEDFAECYSAGMGRPSIPPSLLAKVLLLAYRDGLSDRRAMEALRFDLRWKVALDLPIDHPGFHPTSLVKFRARLLLHGKERIVFERSIELATELGLLDGSVEQIVDSTPMLGAAAIQDTVHAGPRRGPQAASTRSGRSIARQPRGCARRWRSTTRARGRSRRRTGTTSRPAKRCWSRSPPTRSARCERSSATTALVADEAVSAAAGLLREIVGQEFDTADDERAPRPRHGRRSRQIISAHDPEMRHGRKTNARRFTGYKLHVATAAQAPVVTAVTISPGNEHDGHHAAALVEQQPAARRPARVIGDTAYGNVEVREQLEQRAIRVLAPLHTTGATNDDDHVAQGPASRSTSTTRHRHLPAGQDRQRSTSPGRSRPARRRTPRRALLPRRLRALPAPRALRARRPTRRSASAAAKTSAKPRCANSPTRPSATTSNAPDHASNDSSA